jgi:hypothetical protein
MAFLKLGSAWHQRHEAEEFDIIPEEEGEVGVVVSCCRDDAQAAPCDESA